MNFCTPQKSPLKSLIFSPILETPPRVDRKKKGRPLVTPPNTLHIRDFLRTKNFIGAKAELRLKDVNAYLVQKLNLQKNPAKTRSEVVQVWEKYAAQIRDLEN